MRQVYRLGDDLHAVETNRDAHGVLHATIGGRQFAVEVLARADGVVILRIDGRRARVHVGAEGDRRFAQVEGEPVLEFIAGEAATARPRRGGAGDDTLVATMHGQVVKVLVKPGDAVARGDTLVVVEAMKMEMRVTAPHDGAVKAVACAEGEVVERGRVLVELEERA